MNISPVALARIYEEDFKQDMAALKVQILEIVNLGVFLSNYFGKESSFESLIWKNKFVAWKLSADFFF